MGKRLPFYELKPNQQLDLYYQGSPRVPDDFVPFPRVPRGRRKGYKRDPKVTARINLKLRAIWSIKKATTPFESLTYRTQRHLWKMNDPRVPADWLPRSELRKR